MSNCIDCRFYRRAKPYSQLLAAAHTTTQAEVIQALGKIVENEQKVLDAERDIKRSQASAGRDTWLGRPLMSDFCAVDAKAGTFRIAEVKNVGGACKQSKPAVRHTHACIDCTHRQIPNGAARDRERLDEYAQLSTSARLAEASSQQTDSMLDSYRKEIAERRAFELTGAYNAGGHLATRPEYLDSCQAFSNEDDFVVCALQNPWHDCDRWSRAQTPRAMPAPEQ
jgi:hypothetical protein